MIFPGFVGPSYQSRSANFDAQRTLNMFPEVSGSGSSKSVSMLLGTPGILLFITLPAGAIRGMFAGGGRLFAVAGTDLYEVFADQTYTDRSLMGGGHPLVNDSLPVLMAPTGNQLGLSSGGYFYCDNGSGPDPAHFSTSTGTVDTVGTAVVWASGDLFDTLWVGNVITIAASNYTITAITDTTHLTINSTAGTHSGSAYSISPVVPASTMTFLGGYFIVSIPNSKQFNISALNDGTTWDELDFGTKDAYPDQIARVFADRNLLWIFGKEQSTEVWQNTGAALFPFQQVQGSLINYGCAAPYSVARLGNGLAWLALDTSRGGVTCVYAQGFSPSVISTPAVEFAWNGYATVADAVAFSYTEEKHQFLVISFPTASATWVYDATTNQWHERGWWSGSANIRQRQAFHSYTNLLVHGGSSAIPARHWVGDWQNGKIYIQNLGYTTDDGTQIQRIRACPHLSNEQKFLFYSQLSVDMQVPSGGPSTINPVLDWSDDGGFNFGTAHAYPGGATSTLGRATRVIWRRLGRSRDRVFRLKITDAVPIALVGCYLEFEVGEF